MDHQAALRERSRHSQPFNPALAYADYMRAAAASFHLLMPPANLWPLAARSLLTPSAAPQIDFQMERAVIPGAVIQPELFTVSPFSQLWSFLKDDKVDYPHAFIVAPDSGHDPAVIREQIHALLPYFNVHVLGRIDPHYVPLGAGASGLERHVTDALAALRYLRERGWPPMALLTGTSQGGLIALITQAILSAQPELRSMAADKLAIIASPIDTTINPNGLCHQAKYGIDPGFSRVGTEFTGAGRMMMRGETLEFLRGGPTAACKAALQAVGKAEIEDTLLRVYREHWLPRDRWDHAGYRVDPSAIRVPIFTAETSHDDVCSTGQTHLGVARLTPQARHVPHTYPGGHYAVVEGKGVRTVMHDLHHFVLA